MLAFLYALAMLGLLVYGLNLLWLAVQHARTDPGREPEPSAEPPGGAWPAVTVQLPLYNEAAVAERVIDAVAALDYPRDRLEVQVLDDSTDETAGLVAARVQAWRTRGLDVYHIRRPDREGFKAGALQNGLRFARGAFVAVFDADFVPAPNFLRRTLPAFDGADVGLVQARWAHANADESVLTRLQAFGLDAHFALEQQVRQRTGLFMNFNGTAGVWRRACIDAAGGWDGDTLTEDLDLSYRAQLAGWRFRYLNGVEVPADLPETTAALQAQQFRWAKGAIETSRKLLGRLWRSACPLRVKVEGTFHLTAHAVFPFVLLAALVHAPLHAAAALGRGPGEAYFAAMGLGLLGFGGFVLAQALAQRDLYPGWLRRLGWMPLFMAGTMGLALSNTRAVWQGLRRRPTAFVRTPKRGTHRRARYRSATRGAWAEAAFALYCLAGLGVLAAAGAWAALPFQALFALGFGLVAWTSLRPDAGRAAPRLGLRSRIA